MCINSTQKVIQIAHISWLLNAWMSMHLNTCCNTSQQFHRPPPLLQGHQDPSIPAVRQTEGAQEQEAGHQPGRNRVNGKLETSNGFNPTSRAAVRRWWAASWGRVWRETQSPRCITGRMGKTDKSSVFHLLATGNHSFPPPWRTTIKDADAKSKPRVTGGWCLGQCRSLCVLPNKNASKSCCLEDLSILPFWSLPLWTRCLWKNHQASSSVPLNYVFVDKAKAKHPMIATIPAGTRCGFPRFMASARWTIRAECTVNVGWMGKCCL